MAMPYNPSRQVRNPFAGLRPPTQGRPVVQPNPMTTNPMLGAGYHERDPQFGLSDPRGPGRTENRGQHVPALQAGPTRVTGHGSSGPRLPGGRGEPGGTQDAAAPVTTPWGVSGQPLAGAPLGMVGYFKDPRNPNIIHQIMPNGAVNFNVSAATVAQYFKTHPRKKYINPFAITGGKFDWFPSGGFVGGANPTQPVNSWLGPWLEGFQTSGTAWMPLQGGGYLNTNTGQTWKDGQPLPTTGGSPSPTTPTNGGLASSFEQQLYQALIQSLAGL